MSITDKYRTILAELEQHRNADETASPVRIIAVSKKHSVESIQIARSAGITDFGENRARELRDKARQLPGTIEGGDIRWHMIGHLQSNKVKEIIGHVDTIHSLDRLSLAKEIQKRAEESDRHIDCLVQVNISDESQKYGLESNQLEPFLRSLENLDRLNIIGLMGMASFSDDKELIRRQFSSLRNLRDGVSPGLPHLSMGMSNDYLIAVEEGATMLRIGTGIFGPRPGAF
ncbi:MAG: YggS family pyridoxal phosphate-dependent enzyme [Rhodothermales bacterium]|nr:YggS family pyridoxal phosphate-dependent enzyme [Rhodothermales bacterium]